MVCRCLSVNPLCAFSVYGGTGIDLGSGWMGTGCRLDLTNRLPVRERSGFVGRVCVDGAPLRGRRRALYTAGIGHLPLRRCYLLSAPAGWLNSEAAMTYRAALAVGHSAQPSRRCSERPRTVYHHLPYGTSRIVVSWKAPGVHGIVKRAGKTSRRVTDPLLPRFLRRKERSFAIHGKLSQNPLLSPESRGGRPPVSCAESVPMAAFVRLCGAGPLVRACPGPAIDGGRPQPCVYLIILVY